MAEDPAHPEGRHILLDGFVVPATKPGPETRALFSFGGGPGERETDDVEDAMDLSKVLPEFDIVNIDQRGSGETPDIRCGPGTDDASIQAALIDEVAARPHPRLRRGAEGARTRLHTTANSAIDFDLERQALGYNKIDLIGGSYGTRMAQAYIHLYPGTRWCSAARTASRRRTPRRLEAAARCCSKSALRGVIDLCMEDTCSGLRLERISPSESNGRRGSDHRTRPTRARR